MTLQEWINAEAGKLQYGEIVVRVKVHQGDVKRIEKTVSTYEQPEHTSAGSHNDRRR